MADEQSDDSQETKVTNQVVDQGHLGDSGSRCAGDQLARG